MNNKTISPGITARSLWFVIILAISIIIFNIAAIQTSSAIGKPNNKNAHHIGDIISNQKSDAASTAGRDANNVDENSTLWPKTAEGISAGFSYAERLECMRVVEKTFWDYRIWPAYNPGRKPDFSEVMSEEMMRAKVDNVLKKTNALAYYWNKNIRGADLQGEMNRMASHTKKPELLRDIFSHLNNDPHKIAECLARPLLADRTIRELYDKGIAVQQESVQGGVIESFDSWWNTAKQSISLSESASDYTYSLPDILDNACGEDSWTPTSMVDAPGERYIHTAVWTGTEMIIWGGWDESTTVNAQNAKPSEMVYLNSGGKYNPATDTWIATSEINAPAGRTFHTAVWTGSEMIIWGGDAPGAGDGTPTNSGGRYNPVTDTWVSTSQVNAPERRQNHTAVWSGSEMIIWGGLIGSPVTWTKTGGRYNPISDSWTATNVPPDPWAARMDHSAIWAGDCMIIWGGRDSLSITLNDGGRYYPSTDTWIYTSTVNAPDSRRNTQPVWTGTEMIIWGGYNYYSHQINTGARYNPSTDTWITMPTTNAPAARANHSAVWTGTEMIIWGGDINENTGGRFNPAINTWASDTTVNNAPLPRISHTTVWTGTEMIIWGGFNSIAHELGDGARYTPAPAGSWTATITTGAPTARTYGASVWTGTEMIVWGGSNGTSYPVDGGKYNPATDSWTATTTTGVPIGRQHLASIWTGTEMIIWGGEIFGGNTNTGGRYNPTTDTWTATPTSDAPPGRFVHTGVWTGTEMIIWGGEISSGNTNTGSRYNPTTNTWTATTTINAPQARQNHAAIWTGSEMIVWGGSTGSYLNTGGRYNAVTNSWTATSTTDAPTGREWPGMAWTGTEMIVWGGNSSSCQNTGGRYNPSTNTWAALPITGAPVCRTGPAIVWTGSEVIVWGGTTDSGDSNTGGKYNPSSNSWTDLSTVNAPSARHGHKGIWTGSEFIVWGGSDLSSNYFNTGGRYCYTPCTPPIFSGAPAVSDPDECTQGITITWEAPASWGGGATSGTYEIRRHSSPLCNAGYTVLASNIPAYSLSYTDTSTPMGNQTLYYEVAAVNDCNPPLISTGNTSCSAGIIDHFAAPPSGLENNTAVDIDNCDDTGIQITWAADPSYWNDNNIGTRHYDVLRDGIDVSSYIPYNTTTITDINGVNGRTYTYTVRYKNGCSLSSLTTGAQSADWGFPPIGAGVPSTSDINGCADDGVAVYWSADPIEEWGDNNIGTRTYDLYRSGLILASGIAYGTTFYIDTMGDDNSTYGYKIIYNNGCGFSLSSIYVWGQDQVGTNPSGLSNNTAIDADACNDSGVLITWAQDAGDWGDTTGGYRTYSILRDSTVLAFGIPYGTTTYLDTTGTNNQNYVYAVRYTNLCGFSSTTVGVTAADIIAVAPNGLNNNTAADINSCLSNGIQITWDSDPANWGDYGTGTRSYSVLRNGAPIATNLSYGTISYIDTLTTSGTLYTYQVVYVNGCGLSDTTTGASATETSGSAPSGLTNNTAIDLSACTLGISISWQADPSDWGDGNTGTRTYTVLRDGISAAINLPYSSSNYIDTTTSAGVSYAYTVRYNNGCGYSADTSPGVTLEDSLDVIPCPSVSNTVLVMKSAGDAVISWSAVTCGDLANYKVYGSSTYDAPFPSGWSTLATPTATTQSDPLSSDNVAYLIVTIDTCLNEN